MKFSCQRCGKRYFTGQDLRGDRVYKMTCRVCGHPIVIRGSDALEKNPGRSSALGAAASAAHGGNEVATGRATALPFPGLSDDPFAHPLPPLADDRGAVRRDPAPPAADDDELQVEVTVDLDFEAPGDDLRFEPVAVAPSEPRPRAQVTLWRPPPDPWPPPRTTARVGLRIAAIAGLAAVSVAAVVVGFFEYGPRARLGRPAAEAAQEAALPAAAPQGITVPPAAPGAGEGAGSPQVTSQLPGSQGPPPGAAAVAPPREARAADPRREPAVAKADGGAPRPRREADLARVERERAARVEPRSGATDDEDAGDAEEAESAPASKPPASDKAEPRPEATTESSIAAATPAPAARSERSSTAPEAEAAPRLDAAQIARTLEASRPSLDSCLAAAKGNKALEKRGRRLALTLLVHADGHVTDPVVDDPALEQTDLGGCLRMAGRAIVFPAFQGEPQRVTVPLAVPRP